MCGINGIVLFQNSFVKRTQIEKMNALIKHRGPDNEGVYVFKNVGLGYLRLSIIDTVEQRQPILHSEDENYWIAFNGEIYNYLEIRARLIEKGHTFYTQTDTEVVLHAYQEYGDSFVTQLNGMFAFAIFDKIKNRMFLARDRLGIKPLYFYNTITDNNLDDSHLNGNNSNEVHSVPHQFIFSSEIKAILPFVAAKKLNDHALIDYLVFRTPLHEKTFFQGISLLAAGNYLVLDLSQDISNPQKKEFSRIQQKQYWDISFDYKPFKNVEQVVEQYKLILDRSVVRHLIADVPLGCYLSGGFDSSSVAVTAAKKIDRRLETFTGAFEEGEAFDERQRSRMLGQKINALVMESVITPKMFLQSFKEVIYSLDEPKVGSPAIAQYYVAKLASKHVKVVLTGHGGDELFLGYIPYKSIFLKQEFQKNPLLLRKLGKSIGKQELLPLSYYLFYSFFRKELGLGIFTLFSKKELQSLFSDEFKKRNKDYDAFKELSLYCKGKKFTKLQESQYYNLKIFLPALFIVEDKMSMIHSIESRVPFCDNEMVEFALSLPEEFKLHNGVGKYIVKEAMRGELPQEFYTAKKMGFPTPFKKWFAEDLKEYVQNLLLSEQFKSRGIFNQKTVAKMFIDHCKGKTDYSYQLWALMSIEMWHRLFLDD